MASLRTLLGMAALALAISTSASTSTAPSAPRSVSYDGRSFLLNGERVLILSGSIHYQRVLPADWPRVLALAVELGFNTIQTYVFADEHQPSSITQPWDFSGRNNITAFASLAASLGLNVVVRIGPYACGEHFNGGVPLWMRSDQGSSAQCFRCSDPAWEAFSAEALAAVVGELKANSLLWPQGGPVIALQVENEYNGPDLKYLETVVSSARNQTSAVPWILCHDLPLCSQVNKDLNVGPGGAALCSINGFWEDGSEEGVSQPSPAFVKGQQQQNPGQPVMWTEDQGWFDQWGMGQRVRISSDILYGVARFVSYGGTHHNFYMLTGGSNFGYSAADGVTTAYAPDTAIDFLLLRHEPKFSTFQSFFAALLRVAPVLLAAPAATPVPVGKNCETATYGNVTFVSNFGVGSNTSEVVTVMGVQLFLPNHTVVILEGTTVVANTSAGVDAGPDARKKLPPSRASSGPAVWTTLVEEVGYGNRSAAPASGAAPLEQLALTLNQVDYMWYSLSAGSNGSLPVQNASSLQVHTCGGEYVYVFADGAAMPRHPSAPQSGARRTMHTFLLHSHAAAAAAAAAGSVTRIDILVSAMGLSTSPTPTSCKGVQRVVSGSTDLTHLGWVSKWVFAGEAAQVYTPEGAAKAAWQPVGPDGGTVVTSWFKTTFDLPDPPSPPTGNPPQLAYALDLLGATKGVVWVNGVNLGRYNLELGVCSGPCAPPIHGGMCYIFWNNCGQPTQRYYHVPTSILNPTGNLVVLFEETATVPQAGSGPVAPSPPPWSHSGSSSISIIPTAPAPVSRNLATVTLVALVDHPN
jgi:hypothetical protein